MAQTYAKIPLDPPPPYQADRDTVTLPQSTLFYHDLARSQPYVVPSQPKILRKKRSAWICSNHVGSPEKSQPRAPGRSCQSTTSNAVTPASRGFQECVLARSMNQAAAMCDVIAERFNDMIARIDGGRPDVAGEDVETMMRDLSLEYTNFRPIPDVVDRAVHDRQAAEQSRSHIINIRKAWMYANSRLKPHIAPFKVYMPTWQIFCKAANASTAVYQRPLRGEREDYIAANWRAATKAMVLKTTPMDTQNLIIVAIRGSQWNVVDWAVNFTIAPTEPVGFLDDQGNACHAGFLQVARSMIQPVATRLKDLIGQSSSEAPISVLFTGHSAGGAVANLLYMHMLSETVSSELTQLRGWLKRIHCVTFGVPPISLLPLQRPNGSKDGKNVFVSFVNEGDPIVRTDLHYMASLFRLYASPAPKTAASAGNVLKQKASRQTIRGKEARPAKSAPPPSWPVPDAILSNAGRLVLLREQPGSSSKVEAVGISDDQLRHVVFGDPVMHHMDVYRRRIENLAVFAVTGRDGG